MKRDDIAELVIAANETKKDSSKDELGLLLPVEQTPQCRCEYLVARAFAINKHLHTRHAGQVLFNGHEVIACNRSAISYLCRSLWWIKNIEVQYIYNRIKELAPSLDERKIAITPTIYWDMDRQVLVESDRPLNVISDWQDSRGRQSGGRG